MKLLNGKLIKAKINKNDEFYTSYSTIEKELIMYKDQLYNKIIFCNCNDDDKNFFHYFKNNFENFKLKCCYFSHYNQDGGKSFVIRLTENNTIEKLPIESNGSYKSEDCIEILKQSDIVITNPPFSIFRDFIEVLMKYDKKFLVIGNINIITTIQMFDYYIKDKIRLGYHNDGLLFNNYKTGAKDERLGFCCWWTNLEVAPIKPIKLKYSFFELKGKYQVYNYYKAINIDKIEYIPNDFYGNIGVPITFIKYLCKDQFKLIDTIGNKSHVNYDLNESNLHLTQIGDDNKYRRLIIRRIKNKNDSKSS